MATQSLTPDLCWPAPAKLNLFLHVLGRRPDGYHHLQTAFQFLDYADELQFTLREDAKIILENDATSIAPQQNLITRAAQLLQQKTGATLGVNIRLHKRIPIGGGLGGGSSNAATTLLALNTLWQLKLPMESLMQLGLSLGADIPIFLYGKAAWAEGVGEQLQPLTLPEPWFVILIPPCQISTAEIFSHPQLTRDTPPITISQFLEGLVRNDCETIVRQLYPEVATALDWLSQYSTAHLTGTGCCVFAAFADHKEALKVAGQIPKGFQGFVAKATNDSPLYKHYIK